jgi:hypothetical protein
VLIEQHEVVEHRHQHGDRGARHLLVDIEAGLAKPGREDRPAGGYWVGSASDPIRIGSAEYAGGLCLDGGPQTAPRITTAPRQQVLASHYWRSNSLRLTAPVRKR